MRALLLSLVVLFSVGCGPVAPEEFDDTASPERTGGETSTGGGAGSSDASGGDVAVTTGGSNPDNTGGADPVGTGGESTGGMGGEPPDATGGAAPVNENCFAQWDETTEYEGLDSVQVGEAIFTVCRPESIAVGVMPVHDGGGWDGLCYQGWTWEGQCPSQVCADAIPWEEATKSYWPPALAGTLFSYEGHVFESEEDVKFLSADQCPPISEPGHWCNETLETAFHLAPHCN